MGPHNKDVTDALARLVHHGTTQQRCHRYTSAILEIVCSGSVVKPSLPSTNRLAYDGAMRVPMAVPCICKWWSPLKVNEFLIRMIWIRWHKSDVGGCWFNLVLRNSLLDVTPSA